MHLHTYVTVVNYKLKSLLFAANVMMDSRSKGFGFVTYTSADEAEKAINEMDGKVIS